MPEKDPPKKPISTADVDDLKTIVDKRIPSRSYSVNRESVPGDELNSQPTIGPGKKIPQAPLPSIVHDRYRIIQELGCGGMGVVFLGKDTKLGRWVAIKQLLNSGAPDTTRSYQLLAEARSLAALDRQKNIVTVWDVSDDPNDPFIVMEYVKGRNLTDLLKQKAPLSVLETYQILKQICEGLQYAHDHGVIHRDIKPSNILLTDDGIAKLTDFGIALQQDFSQNTQTGTAMGSIYYVAPEQLEDAKHVDHRADIYSLGATCYQMLTGESPRIIHLDPLEQDCKKFLCQALAAKPEHRFQSVTLFIEELEGLAQKSSETTPHGQLEPKETIKKPQINPLPKPQKQAEEVQEPFIHVPENLKRDILNQLFTGQDPSTEQFEVWQTTLRLSGGNPLELNKLIDYIGDHNREPIDRERQTRAAQNRQLQGFQSLIVSTITNNNGLPNEIEMRHLYAVGRMVGWTPERVKRECEQVAFRLKLDKSLKKGKGRLTKRVYQQLITEGSPIGWNAEQIEKCIEDHKHLRTLGSGIRVKVVDFFSFFLSRTKIPKNEPVGAIGSNIGKPEKVITTAHEAREKDKRYKATLQKQSEELRKVEEARKELEKEKILKEHQAQIKAEKEARKAADEKRKLEAKRKREAALRNSTFKRSVVIIGAILGIGVAWALAGHRAVGIEAIYALGVGAFLGAIGLPVLVFLLRAVRILVIVFILFLLITLAFLFFQYGIDGTLYHIELFIRKFLH